MTDQTNKGPELKIVRHFNAPKEVVFDAFADKDAMAEWWGPSGMPATVVKFEFKPGGEYHYKLEGNGQIMWGLFKYLNINRADLIEFVSSFSDEQGNVCKSPFPMDFPLEIFNKVTFDENNGRTTLTLQGHPINATDEQKATYASITANMEQGFKGTFDQLERYLSAKYN
ncbi:SRPBCC domain-containing protein [Mucilaginibacter sp.]|uniref:SRPBCC family protein n=1 Tax=Mucilaginibacter sp. TaxID=1882438 RepID=UPI0026235B26|nr:SRPBCC domain-containing protein [Mucilaginibacter sp.]MDB5127774.1 Activator of Hsp90 ATPase 1 family protein [Mucilaginibacter sp.]